MIFFFLRTGKGWEQKCQSLCALALLDVKKLTFSPAVADLHSSETTTAALKSHAFDCERLISAKDTAKFQSAHSTVNYTELFKWDRLVGEEARYQQVNKEPSTFPQIQNIDTIYVHISIMTNVLSSMDSNPVLHKCARKHHWNRSTTTRSCGRSQ